MVSVLRSALVSETNSSLELYGITVFGRGFAETRNLDVWAIGPKLSQISAERWGRW